MSFANKKKTIKFFLNLTWSRVNSAASDYLGKVPAFAIIYYSNFGTFFK